MNIICPQCHFTRQVPADKLPKASTMATCPQCQFRFKVDIDAMAQAAHANHNADHRADHRANHQTDAAHTAQQDSGAPIHSNSEAKQEASPKPQPAQEEKPIVHYKASAENGHEAYARQQQTTKQAEKLAQEQEKFDEDAAFAAFALDNPWEKPETIGYFTAFYQTILRVLFMGPRFFAGLMPEGSQKRALLFFVIVGVLQITFERFWGGIISEALAPTAADDPQLQAMLAMLSPQSSYSLALLFGAGLSILELFFSSAIYYVIFRLIAPGRAHFNLIFQVVAYASAPMLLCLVPALGSVVGFVWSIACTAVGCRYAMRLSWGHTLLGVLPVYVIGLPLILQFVFSAS